MPFKDPIKQKEYDTDKYLRKIKEKVYVRRTKHSGKGLSITHFTGSSKRYLARKDSQENARLQYRYGINLIQFEEMRDIQDQKCYICRKEEKIIGHKLCVDHNHKTGRVRGLLCRNCNTGLGKFQEDLLTMLNAYNYLYEDKAHAGGF